MAINGPGKVSIIKNCYSEHGIAVPYNANDGCSIATQSMALLCHIMPTKAANGGKRLLRANGLFKVLLSLLVEAD